MNLLTVNEEAIRRRCPAASVESNLSPRRQPFLYLTAALVAGILFDRWLEPAPLCAALIGLVSIAVATRFVVGTKSGNAKSGGTKSAAATLALLAGFAAVGALLSQSERVSPTDSRLKRLFDERIITPDEAVELTGVLLAPPEPAPAARFLDVEAESVRAGGEDISASGCARLMISLPDGEAERQFNDLALDYGSRVRVLVRLERARSYGNPGSPDFNDFLERRGYDLKGVIKSSLLIEQAGQARVNPLLAWLYHLRLRMMGAIDAHVEARAAGTLKAMLVGNSYFLDPDVGERLRESATFHVLVISGSHISLIAWVLLRFPVSPASWKSMKERSKTGRRSLVRTLISMSVLWAYAVMVGLAPPVTRAAWMITAGLIGPLIFRRAASINTVSLAAFVMMALKPALVADPGFQLSFIAVASLVTLALPLINTLRRIGEWHPSAHAPHPPRCSPAIKAFAETLFWDERKFRKEMSRSPVRYRLDKARAALVLGRLRMQPLVRVLAMLAIASTMIQLSTLPLMALYFNRVSPVGVLLNVTAGLLTAALMFLALGAIASAWIAAKVGWIIIASHTALVNQIAPFAEIQFATFRVAHYEGWHALIYALYFIPLAALAVLIDRWRPVDHVFTVERKSVASRKFRVPASLCALALAAALIAVINPSTVPPDGKLTIHFLDVGQGDAALVIFPRGATMLVDAGGELRFKNEPQAIDDGQSDQESESVFNSEFSVGEAVVSRFLWSQGRTQIDYVLATHAHADHVGGLSDVVKNFGTGQALVGYGPESDREFKRFVAEARKRAIPISAVNAGEQFELEGVNVEVLWPRRVPEASVASGNNDSVVLRLVYNSVSVLLAGDIERGTEEALAGSGVDLQADVLKVPHHGSKTSSTDNFIDRVHPRYAVISAGERSRFGHPHAVVVNRYSARGVRLLQTGIDGMITLETDGTSLDISTYK
ncbi:MAG: ComEC/Rec2 family competence protein [Blastocatellia bacterium]